MKNKQNLVPNDRHEAEYAAFLSRKIEAGRVSMRAGVGSSDDAVEAAFAARRAHARNTDASADYARKLCSD